MDELGRRERKKRQTRLTMRSAALRLVAEHGLEGVTVEAIAEAADVSTRTFFNYFPNKEEAVIGLEAEGLSEVVAQFAARPADEEPLFSLHAVLRDIAAQMVDARELLLLRRQVVEQNPSLLPRQVAAFVQFEQALVEAVRERSTTSEADSALVVACSVAALRLSVDRWIAGEGESLPDLLEHAIQRLAVGLTAHSPRKSLTKDVR